MYTTSHVSEEAILDIPANVLYFNWRQIWYQMVVILNSSSLHSW